MKDLNAANSRIKAEWQDAKAREVEEAFVEPVEPHVRALLLAIAELAEILASAERACGGESV